MNDDIIRSLQVERSEVSQSHIMVIGVGGGGGNAVNYMHRLGIKDVDFMVCNTDQQALNISPIELKVRLGEEGLGAGNDPATGRQAAIASLDLIKQKFENYSTKMIFIAAAMGGGTGTGAAPVIAKAASEMGILTVGIVTTPMRKEGPLRFQQAIEGINELKASVDSLLIIDSDKIATLSRQMSLNDAYSLPDNVLATAVKGIAEIVTITSSRTNIDFADVSKVMCRSGRTHMGVGRASGANRAENAVDMALHSPLLDTNSIRGARNILLNVCCKNSDSLIYSELMTILEVIQSEAKYIDENGQQCNANIIWGNCDKPDLNDDLEVVVVATGFVETVPKVVKTIAEPKEEPTEEPIDEPIESPKVVEKDTTENASGTFDIWEEIKKFTQKTIDWLEDLDRQNPDVNF